MLLMHVTLLEVLKLPVHGRRTKACVRRHDGGLEHESPGRDMGRGSEEKCAQVGGFADTAFNLAASLDLILTGSLRRRPNASKVFEAA